MSLSNARSVEEQTRSILIGIRATVNGGVISNVQSAL